MARKTKDPKLVALNDRANQAQEQFQRCYSRFVRAFNRMEKARKRLIRLRKQIATYDPSPGKEKTS